jgi:uncharacterized protein with ParB-like and HNH nuclease domain
VSRIEAWPKSVRDILSSRKYGIDEYQREYKWGHQNIEELIGDLSNKFTMDYQETDSRQKVSGYNHYFLGSIILNNRNGKDFIIDGQQRITSLTLLLIYLHHLLEDQVKDGVIENPPKIIDMIFSEKYGERSYNLDVPERISCLEKLFQNLSNEIDQTDESVSNMIARYNDIEEQFPEDLKGKALPYFTDWVTDNVQFVEILAHSSEDAYTIFETMNDRGQPLNPADMLKGYLLSQISDPQRRSNANTTWRKHTVNLMELSKDELSDFLKIWLKAKYADTIRKRKKGESNKDFELLGTTFHKWVRDNNRKIGLNEAADYYNFIQDKFTKFSNIYMLIREASNNLTPGLESIYYNSSIHFTLQYPLLLASILQEDSEGLIKRKLRLVSDFLDILIVRRAVNYYTLNYSTMVYAVFLLIKDIRNKTIDEVSTILIDYLKRLKFDFEGCSNETWRQGLTNFGINNWSKRYIHHILARITAHVESQSGEPNRYPEYINRSAGTPFEIEHILADHHERHLDEYDSPQEFQNDRNLISGLILLPKGINQSYGDLPYPEKRKHYITQNILAKSLHEQCYERNPSFLSYAERGSHPFKPHIEFKKKDIRERQKLYLNLCQEIWNESNLIIK